MIEQFFGIFMLLIWVLILGLSIGAFVFWVMMIVDVAKHDFKKPDEKIIWILVVVLAGWIGALIYYFAGRKL